MKKVYMAVMFVFLASVLLGAKMAIPEYTQDGQQGRYSCFVTQNQSGTNRQVIVFDSTDGSFDVYELDNKGLDRKTNTEYYPCFHFDNQNKTRSVRMVKDAE
jgi:hypothetical protein